MYVSRDVSANTDLRVGGRRTAKRIGAVIHTTEGTNSLAWLQGGSAASGSPASSDALISSNGARFWLTAPGRYAFHAGVSRLITQTRKEVAGITVTNDLVSQCLIGIELERTGDQVVTDQQLDSCAELICLQAIEHSWRWPFLIVGHYSIARPLGRRADPVNFDWGAFAGRLLYWANKMNIPGIQP